MSSQELGPKEQHNFDQISRFFDRSEYAKAVKVADQVLAVKPEHGETLAMKGVSLHSLLHEDHGRKPAPEKLQEAIELAKTGLRYHMRSSICWHCLAMMHKADHNYTEALKAYKQAAKLDTAETSTTIINILRDCAVVACQLRDWDTFSEMRQKMLGRKANVRAHWLGVAVAHYMQGNYDLCLAILDVMVTIMDAGENDVEKNEIELFRVEVALQCNKPAVAQQLLKDNDKTIKDELVKSQLKAKTFGLLGQKEKAAECYQKLIANGDHELDSILAIAKLKGIKLSAAHIPSTPEEATKFTELLRGIVKQNPKCGVAEKLLLDVCPLEEFKETFTAFSTPFVTKTIPSLFSVVKSTYQREPERVSLMGDVFLQFAEELEAKDPNHRFGAEFNPSCIVWVYTFLANHYSRIGDHKKGHEFIDKAINHSPTIEMLYLHRAKVLRREGKIAEAAEAADTARKLDLQDKYLNSKAAKYMLRAGRIDDAEQTMGLFFKKSDVNDHYLTAMDSQTIWYERELGKAYMARGDYSSALHAFLLFEKHRNDDHLAMQDFHGYCLRKCNVRPWLELVTKEPVPLDAKFFLLGCPHVVRCYIKVAELGEDAIKGAHVPRPEFPPTGKAEEDTRLANLVKELMFPVDLQNPLDKATKYVDALVAHKPSDPLSHEVAFEYHMAKDQPLGCAKAINALSKLKSPSTAVLVAKFKEWRSQKGASWKAPVIAALSNCAPLNE